MKTFDEAIEAINEQTKTPLFIENFNVANHYMDNKIFVNCIDQWASMLLNEILLNTDHPMVLISSRMHMIFQVGVMVGMEMEKKDE